MFAEIPFRGDPENDAELVAIFSANPLCLLELSSTGSILVSMLPGAITAPKKIEASLQLRSWVKTAGGKAYGPSTFFRLPDRAVLSPDTAWISPERLDPRAERLGEPAFCRVCPDVVIEVESPWDSWPELMQKIDRYECNGASYAVAVDPEGRDVHERGTPPDDLRLKFEAIFDA